MKGNKSSLRKIEKRAGVFAATLLLAASVPAAIKGLNINVHAARGDEPMSQIEKDLDANDKNNKSYQAKEAADQQASDEGRMEEMKTDPSKAYDAMYDAFNEHEHVNPQVLQKAENTEKHDIAHHTWGSPTIGPSKYHKGVYSYDGHKFHYYGSAAMHTRHHSNYKNRKYSKRITKRNRVVKRNHKARVNRNKRSYKSHKHTKHLSYYSQGRNLGKYIHNREDDNYGGVQYLLNNHKLSNKNFRNGYYKGYITAFPGDDENPKPRAKAAFKIAGAYQASHNKMFKRGIVDGIKADYYGKPNHRYAHNKEYRLGFKLFSQIERFHD